MSYVLVTLRRRFKVAFSNFFFTFQPRLSQTRDKNPWHTSEYKGNVYRNLLTTLVPDVFRSCCNQLKLITDSQTERLMHQKIRIEHNEQLLMMISSSGFRGYAKLREIVRSMSDQVEFPDDLLMKMDSVGWDPEGNCYDNLNSIVLSSFKISVYLSF